MAAFAFGRCHSTLTSGALANNDVELVVEEGEELVSQVVDARKMLRQSSLCGVDPAVNAARTVSPECDARPAKRPCRADSGGIDGGDGRGGCAQAPVPTADSVGRDAALVTVDGTRLVGVLPGSASGEATIMVVDGAPRRIAKVFNRPHSGRCTEVAVRVRVASDCTVTVLQHRNIIPLPQETTLTVATPCGGKTTHSVLVYPQYAGDLLSWPPLLARVRAGTRCTLDLVYERAVAGVIRQVVAAVAAAHATNVVHLDLKAENVLFNPPASGAGPQGGDYHVVVIDFGAAAVVPPGHVMCGERGTAVYRSPAMAAGAVYDPRKCDVWGVAAIAIVLLQGRTPSAVGQLAKSFAAIAEGRMCSGFSAGAASFLVCASGGRVTAAELLQHRWLA